MLSSKGGSGACDLRRLCVCVHQKHDLEALVRAVERICVYVCICVCFMEQVMFSVNVCTYVWVARPHAVKLAACSIFLLTVAFLTTSSGLDAYLKRFV